LRCALPIGLILWSLIRIAWSHSNGAVSTNADFPMSRFPIVAQAIPIGGVVDIGDEEHLPAIAVSIHTITTTNSPKKNFLSLNGSPKNLRTYRHSKEHPPSWMAGEFVRVESSQKQATPSLDFRVSPIGYTLGRNREVTAGFSCGE
jgi:hypothetical protein